MTGSMSLDELRLNLEAQKHADDMELRKRALALDEARLTRQGNDLLKTSLQFLIPSLLSVVVGISAAYITARATIAAKTLEERSALDVEQKITERELEMQNRQQRFDIIVQATKDVKREVAIQNLEFFVQVGILNDDDGAILAQAKKGTAPEFGTSPRANNLTTGDDGIRLIKEFTDLDLTVSRRRDGAEVIGFGHAFSFPVVTLKDGRTIDMTSGRITEEQADLVLRHDLGQLEELVNENVRVTLLQSEFDVLMSLIVDIGITKFEQGEILRVLNRGEFEKVPALIGQFVYVANLPDARRAARRAAEIGLWAQSNR